MNKGGQKPGLQRGDRRRFPYEPRVIGGKLVMPAELWPHSRNALRPASPSLNEVLAHWLLCRHSDAEQKKPHRGCG